MRWHFPPAFTIAFSLIAGTIMDNCTPKDTCSMYNIPHIAHVTVNAEEATETERVHSDSF